MGLGSTDLAFGFKNGITHGIRLWVDEQLLIDQWREQSATTYSAQTYLGSGHHLVRVEYFDRFGDAVVRVSYNQGSQPPPPPQPIYNWRAEYFNNKSLSGPPAVVRDEPRVDFSWGGGSPAPGVIDADGFSARWSQSLNLPPGNYRFTITVDDGARLFVNGHLLIDAWKDQSPRTYVGDIYLPGGAITVQMEYYENAGGAVARLAWNSGSQPPPPPPPPTTDAYGFVTVYRLNVRSGPSLYYPVMGWLYRGEQVWLVGRNSAGTWFKIEAAYNFRGWVNAYYVRSNVPSYNLPVAECFCSTSCAGSLLFCCLQPSKYFAHILAPEPGNMTGRGKWFFVKEAGQVVILNSEAGLLVKFPF